MRNRYLLLPLLASGLLMFSTGCNVARKLASGLSPKAKNIVDNTSGIGTYDPETWQPVVIPGSPSPCRGVRPGENVAYGVSTDGCFRSTVVSLGGVRVVYSDVSGFSVPLNNFITLNSAGTVINVSLGDGLSIDYTKQGNYFFPPLKSGIRVSVDTATSKIVFETSASKSFYSQGQSGKYYLSSIKSFYGDTLQFNKEVTLIRDSSYKVTQIHFPLNWKTIVTYDGLLPSDIAIYRLGIVQDSLHVDIDGNLVRSVTVPGHENQNLTTKILFDSQNKIGHIVDSSNASIEYIRGVESGSKLVVKSIQTRNPNGGKNGLINFNFCPGSPGKLSVAYPTKTGIVDQIITYSLENQTSGVGKVLTVEDPVGFATTYTYQNNPNDLFSLVSTVRGYDGISYRYDYFAGTSALSDETVLSTNKKLYHATHATTPASISDWLLVATEADVWNSITSYTYDSYGRLVTTTAAGSTSVQNIQADGSGFKVCSRPFLLSAESCTSFNLLGQPVSSQDSSGTSSNTTYNSNGQSIRTTSSTGDRVDNTWNASKNRLDSVSSFPSGHTKTFSYTGNDVLKQVNTNTNESKVTAFDDLGGVRGTSSKLLSNPATTTLLKVSSDQKQYEYSINGFVMSDVTLKDVPPTPELSCE